MRRLRDEIIYSEEIEALLVLVRDQICRTDPSEVAEMIGLGHLHLKLTAMLVVAPSGRTVEASA